MIRYLIQSERVVKNTMLGKMVTTDLLVMSNPNFIALLDVLIEEASERNHYANNLLDYSFEYKDDSDYKKFIYCHPETINFLIHLDSYDLEATTVESKNGEVVKIKYNRKMPLNKMKFVDGLYTNEIMLIEMSEVK
jgi:hypothetical protein